jgi:hypothetical protein
MMFYIYDNNQGDFTTLWLYLMFVRYGKYRDVTSPWYYCLKCIMMFYIYDNNQGDFTTLWLYLMFVRYGKYRDVTSPWYYCLKCIMMFSYL